MIVALGSLANSVEVRDHDNQLHKVSASLRRLLTGAAGSSAAFERDGFVFEEADDVNVDAFDDIGNSNAGFKRDFVGIEGVDYAGMLPSWFRPTAADVAHTVDKLDFEGEEGMLPAGFIPTAADVNGEFFDRPTAADPDTVDRLDLVGGEGMLPAGFVFEGADDVNVDGFDDFVNGNAANMAGPGWVGDDSEGDAAEDGFPGMHNGFPGMHDDFPVPNDWILLRSNVECGNNENEVNLGTFTDVALCAEACKNRDGCTNFIYGKGEKAGRCWDEAITESACTIWETDQYDFYGLTGGNF